MHRRAGRDKRPALYCFAVPVAVADIADYTKYLQVSIYQHITRL